MRAAEVTLEVILCEYSRQKARAASPQADRNKNFMQAGVVVGDAFGIMVAELCAAAVWIRFLIITPQLSQSCRKVSTTPACAKCTLFRQRMIIIGVIADILNCCSLRLIQRRGRAPSSLQNSHRKQVMQV